MASKRGKYLFKNSLVLALGNFGPKFISFILVPVYTNVLSTTQYGIIDLIYTIGTVLIPFLTLNVSEAIMRFALDEDADQDAILSTGILGIFLSFVLGIVAIPCGFVLPSIKPYIRYLYMYMITLAICQVFLSNLRGRELLFKYSIGNIIYAFSIALLNIIFLVAMNKGVEGYFAAYILANIITAIYAFISGNAINSIKKFHINKSLSKTMLMYSVVLIPNSFMWWIMNSSDRIMVTAIVGAAANGIYAVAYKVPTLLSTISIVFNQAWSYSAIREQVSEDRVAYNNEVYRNLKAIVFIVASGLMMIMKVFLKYYVGNDYYVAWRYTPILIIGFVFMTLGSFVATSYTVYKDSVGFLVSGIIGAATNVFLNFCLIPLCGAMGAAIATSFSLFVVFVFRSWNTRKYLKLEVINREEFAGISLLILNAFTMFINSSIGQICLIIEFFIMILLYKRVVLDFAKNILKRIDRNNSKRKKQ